MRDQLREFGRSAQEALDRLSFGFAINLEQSARGRIDDCGPSLRVEGDETRRHAGDNPLAELFRARRTCACPRAQYLKLSLLGAQLRHDRLKCFQHELRLIACAFRSSRNGRALRFAEQLPVRAQQPTRQQHDAGHAHDKRDDEDR